MIENKWGCLELSNPQTKSERSRRKSFSLADLSLQQYPAASAGTAADNTCVYGATFGSVAGFAVLRQVGWPKPLGLMPIAPAVDAPEMS